MSIRMINLYYDIVYDEKVKSAISTPTDKTYRPEVPPLTVFWQYRSLKCCSWSRILWPFLFLDWSSDWNNKPKFWLRIYFIWNKNSRLGGWITPFDLVKNLGAGNLFISGFWCGRGCHISRILILHAHRSYIVHGRVHIKFNKGDAGTIVDALFAPNV